jgi:hypothetical protein
MFQLHLCRISVSVPALLVECDVAARDDFVHLEGAVEAGVVPIIGTILNLP